MADNKEEKASFVEVIGAIAGMVASVVNPIIKDIPTPQEPPAIETPAEPSNQDFEDLIEPKRRADKYEKKERIRS